MKKRIAFLLIVLGLTIVINSLRSYFAASKSEHQLYADRRPAFYQHMHTGW